MAGGCGGKTLKAFLVIFNLLFWVSGMGLLLFGIWMLVDPQKSYLLDIVNFSEGDPLLRVSAYIFIGVGVVSVVIGFLGCCGALKEIQSMLAMYSIFLLLILCAEVTAAVFAIVFKSQYSGPELEERLYTMAHERYGRLQWVTDFMDTVHYYMSENLKRDMGNMVRGDYGKGEAGDELSVTRLINKLQFYLLVWLEEAAVRSVREQYGTGPGSRVLTKAIDKLQFQEQCCGVDGPEDWTGSFWQTRPDLSDGHVIPESCCTQMAEATAVNLVPRGRGHCQTPFATEEAGIDITQWRHTKARPASPVPTLTASACLLSAAPHAPFRAPPLLGASRATLPPRRASGAPPRRQNSCCGGRGPADFAGSYWQVTESRGAVQSVPVSCCRLSEASRPWDAMHPLFPRCVRMDVTSQGYADSAWTEGCYEKLQMWFDYYSLVFIIFGISVAAFQLFGVVFSICLCRVVGEQF